MTLLWMFLTRNPKQRVLGPLWMIKLRHQTATVCWKPCNALAFLRVLDRLLNGPARSEALPSPAHELGALCETTPRGSKYPIFEVSRPQNHTINGFWDERPQILGTWTLWDCWHVLVAFPASPSFHRGWQSCRHPTSRHWSLTLKSMRNNGPNMLKTARKAL